jgi:hypothetical protein
MCWGRVSSLNEDHAGAGREAPGRQTSAPRGEGQASFPGSHAHTSSGTKRCKLVNRLDTALHITAVLLYSLYVGVIHICLHWHDQMAGSYWHDQML